MDKNQKLVLVVLILAILFSAFSILISINAAKLDLPLSRSTGSVGQNNAGGVGLTVEKSGVAGAGG